MARSRTTPASGADAASKRSLEEHDAELYARYLRDLRQELQDPPELVLWEEELRALGLIGAGGAFYLN